MLEKLPSISSGLYYAKISDIEIHHLINQKFIDPDNFTIWHDRLGHRGSIMIRKMIENSHGHPLKNQKVLKSNEFSYVAYSQGKLITKPSLAKVGVESPAFLE